MKQCRNCNFETEEDTTSECPECGSTNWTHNISSQTNASLSMDVRGYQIKGPSIGKGRRSHQRDVKTEYNYDNDCEVVVIRDVDRKNDSYFEEIKIKETGKVLRRCEEPLSQHRERGDAKKKD